MWGRINERINLMDTQVAVLGFSLRGNVLTANPEGAFQDDVLLNDGVEQCL